MDNIRGPDYELAEKDYISGMKYKDIAEKYNVSLNTVKSWKQRHKWDRKGVHTKEKACIQKTDKYKPVKKDKSEPIAEEVKEVLENTELTDKQRLFCIYYIKYFNATKAYQKAYNCKYDVANSEGYKLLVNPCIKKEIDNLKKAKLNRAMLGKDDIFQKYIDIAFADITDYIEFGQEEVPVMGPFGPIVIKEGAEEPIPVTKIINVVKFKESPDVDGTIIAEVSQGKNGASLKLQDKMKALDFLAKHVGMLDFETQEKLKIAQEKLKVEKSKIKDPNNENKAITFEDEFSELIDK